MHRTLFSNKRSGSRMIGSQKWDARRKKWLPGKKIEVLVVDKQEERLKIVLEGWLIFTENPEAHDRF